jgi:hypothetical protein
VICDSIASRHSPRSRSAESADGSHATPGLHSSDEIAVRVAV